MNIATELIPEEKRRKLPEDESTLGFGVNFTDHMFSMHYSEEKGWFGAKVHPYSIITLDPAALVLHYGQEIFEGLKAYRGENDEIYLFRPLKNLERLNNSADRMCMPKVDADLVLEGIKKLVEVEKEWVPHTPGTSLYIRPTYIATQAVLGVRPSAEYLFYVILSPVGAYYATGFNPVKILVEEKYVRAAPGGVGFAKAGGNYASSLLAAKKAKEEGYTQVLWLDAAEHKYVEEVGTMNMFFVINDTIITSPLTGSILPGVTRDSVLHMLKDWGMNVEERMITIDEVIKAHDDGKLTEAFGTGTAAVVTPVGELRYKDKKMVINDMKVGDLSQKLYDALVGIQYGKDKDPYDWRIKVC
ncbi:MAG: branched-chain amino acid aminotransferase [Candidatus Hodarchaeota archaeon]